jgi:hypothetical protein
MKTEAYRYKFEKGIALRDARDTLLLATVAAEGLHGTACIKMDLCHRFDKQRLTCVIDARSDAGRDVARIFTNILRHEFGADAFNVRAVSAAGIRKLAVRQAASTQQRGRRC